MTWFGTSLLPLVGPQFCFLRNWVSLSVLWTSLVIFRDVFSRSRRGKEDTVRGWGEERERQVKQNLSSSILLLRRTLIFKTAFCYEIFQYIVKLKDFCSKLPSTRYLESILRTLLCLFYHIVFHRCVLCALWTLFCLHGPLGHGDSPQTDTTGPWESWDKLPASHWDHWSRQVGTQRHLGCPLRESFFLQFHRKELLLKWCINCTI